jgi:hypothetical protein
MIARKYLLGRNMGMQKFRDDEDNVFDLPDLSKRFCRATVTVLVRAFTAIRKQRCLTGRHDPLTNV